MCGAIRDQQVSGGDGSQIHIGEKTRNNKPGRVHGNRLETGLTEEEKSSDYLRSLLKTHGKELPPRALLSVMWLSPSARRWLSSEVEANKTNPNLVKDSNKGGSNKVEILQGEVLEESPGLQVGIPSHFSLPASLGGHIWTTWLCSSEQLWFLAD